MKIFKRIYYSAMAALFVLMFTLSFVNATVANKKNNLDEQFVANVNAHLGKIAQLSHNSIYSINQTNVADYIALQLGSSAGLTLGTSYEEEGKTVYNYAVLEGKPIGTYVLQRDTLNEDTQRQIDLDRDNNTAVWEVDKQLTNIVVYIPGTTTLDNYASGSAATGDVVMMMAHYDSRIESAGASNNGTQVASMLENIISLTKSNFLPKNDLLFVFTDAAEEGMYGAYMFKHQFAGFDDIYSRVKLGTNFDALGNKGTLALTASSDNYKLISAYSKIGGNTFASSVASLVFDGTTQNSDFSIYNEIPSLSFANIGGAKILGTTNDNIQNASDATIIQQANMMNSVITTFGDYDLNTLECDTDAVFFSYLDLFTVVYSNIISYVFGAIMVGLIAGIIVMNLRKKVFSWSKTGAGAVVSLLSILASVAALFALYYLFALLTSAMGIVPIRAIGSIIYESVGLMISFMLLSLVISAFMSLVIRKLFVVKSTDIVRGNVLIWGALGIILSFAAPALSYFFAITALLELAMLLAITIFNEKIKSKYGLPVAILFPYMLPLIITIPMIVPAMMITSMMLPSMYIPLIMVVFMLMSGFITPYAAVIKSHADRLLARLPKVSRRVEKEVTEMVEDKAKKGRFVEKTFIKIEKEQYPITYRHGFALTVLTILISIAALVFSSVGFGIGKNYTAQSAYRDAVYHSAMVLVWEKVGDNSEQTFLEIKDFMAYRHINEALGGFSWDFGNQAYVKNIYSTSDVIRSAPSVSLSGSDYNFSVYNSERSLVTVKLNDAERITKLTIKSSEGETFEFENTDKQDTITINLPYKFGSFTMQVEGVDFINVEYTETIMDIGSSIANLAELEEWKDVLDHYSSNESVTDHLTSGIVFRIINNKI